MPNTSDLRYLWAIPHDGPLDSPTFLKEFHSLPVPTQKKLHRLMSRAMTSGFWGRPGNSVKKLADVEGVSELRTMGESPARLYFTINNNELLIVGLRLKEENTDSKLDSGNLRKLGTLDGPKTYLHPRAGITTRYFTFYQEPAELHLELSPTPLREEQEPASPIGDLPKRPRKAERRRSSNAPPPDTHQKARRRQTPEISTSFTTELSTSTQQLAGKVSLGFETLDGLKVTREQERLRNDMIQQRKDRLEADIQEHRHHVAKELQTTFGTHFQVAHLLWHLPVTVAVGCFAIFGTITSPPLLATAVLAYWGASAGLAYVAGRRSRAWANAVSERVWSRTNLAITKYEERVNHLKPSRTHETAYQTALSQTHDELYHLGKSTYQECLEAAHAAFPDLPQQPKRGEGKSLGQAFRAIGLAILYHHEYSVGFEQGLLGEAVRNPGDQQRFQDYVAVLLKEAQKARGVTQGQGLSESIRQNLKAGKVHDSGDISSPEMS